MLQQRAATATPTGLRMLKAAPSTGSDRQTPNLPPSHGEIYSSGPDQQSERAPSVARIPLRLSSKSCPVDTVWQGDGGPNGEREEWKPAHYHM